MPATPEQGQVSHNQFGSWSLAPSKAHPLLHLSCKGYLAHGYAFAFSLNGHAGLLNDVDWATWDSEGQLVFAKAGAVVKYTLLDLRRGEPSFRLDLETLKSPT